MASREDDVRRRQRLLTNQDILPPEPEEPRSQQIPPREGLRRSRNLTGRNLTAGERLGRGLRSVELAGRGFAADILAITGSEELATSQLKEVQTLQRRQAESAPRVRSITDVQSFSDLTDFVSGTLIEQAPILATTIGGGLGGVAARRALPSAIRDKVSRPAAALTGAVGAGTALETGNIFADIGLDPGAEGTLQERAGLALAGGTVAGSFEAIPAFRILDKFGLGRVGRRAVRKGLLKRVAQGTLSQAAIEGGTETAQSAVAQIVGKIANENRELFGPEGMKELFDSFVAGTIVGGGIGGVTGIFEGRAGDVEDQLELEDALDELEERGARSSDIETDLDDLGDLGSLIRESRTLTREADIAEDPSGVLRRLVGEIAAGREIGNRGFQAITEAVEFLDNPVQLQNILIDAGIAPELVEQVAEGLSRQVRKNRVEFLDDLVEEEADIVPGVEIDFQDTELARKFFLRNKQNRLGWVPSNDPEQTNALRDNVNTLEQDFPDIDFAVVGLGDAVFQSLERDIKADPEASNTALLSVAQEKLTEAGFDATRFNELDPADPRAFLNQWKAISQEKVDPRLGERDEFKLTDADLTGGLRPSEVGTTEGEVTISPQKKARFPIFVKRKAKPFETDFTVIVDGKPQQADANSLTRKMLAKMNVERTARQEDIADAFFNGIAALASRGVEFQATPIAPDTVVFRDKSGKPTTYRDITTTGRGKLRARIRSLKNEQERTLEQLKEINKKMRNAGPAAKASMRRITKRLRRRIKKIPSEIEGVQLLKKSVRKDVDRFIAALQDEGTLQELNDQEDAFSGEIATEIEDLARALEREGFSTIAAEQLHDATRTLRSIEERREAAFEDRKVNEGTIEREERQFVEEGQKLNKLDIQFSETLTRGTLGREPALEEINKLRKQARKVAKETFENLKSLLGLTEMELLQGEPARDFMRLLNVAERVTIELKFLGGLRGVHFNVEAMRTREGQESEEALRVLDAELAELGLQGIKSVLVIGSEFVSEGFIKEVVAHEVGHAVFTKHYNDAPPKVQAAIAEDFNAWLESQQRLLLRDADTPIETIQASRAGFEFALNIMTNGFDPANPLTIEEMKKDQLDYLFSFEEWFADQTARWANPVREPQTVVEKWFKDVADFLKKAWVELQRTANFKPAPSVEAFLNNLVKDNKDVRLAAAENVMRESMAPLFNEVKEIQPDPPPLNAAPDADAAFEANLKILEDLKNDKITIAAALQAIDPFSDMYNWMVRSIFRDQFRPGERRILFRYFNKRGVKERLKKLLTDPVQQELIDKSPVHAAAFGYQMWIAGSFKVNPPTQELFQDLFTRLGTVLGFVYESDQALQIFEGIRDGYVTARKAGTGTFSVIKAVRENMLQNAAQMINSAFENVRPYFDEVLGVADARMLNTGIPSLAEMARQFHAQTGSEGVSETYFTARQRWIGEFTNRYMDVTKEIQNDPELKAEVLGLLRNPKKQGSDKAKTIAGKIRKVLRRQRNYMVAAGLDVKDRGKDYFPWVFDPRKVQDNLDRLDNLLRQEKFRPAIESMRDKINRGIKAQNEKRTEAFNKEKERLLRIPEHRRTDRDKADLKRKVVLKRELETFDVIVGILMGLTQSEALADTNLNPDRTGTVPFFASMNTRTLSFLEGNLTPEEQEFFDSLFSDQLDLIMVTYIRQGVKRTEYTRRFNGDSSGLEQLFENAAEEGATPAQLRMAHRYVDAMMGTIGESTNNRISSVLGIGKRDGEIINPHWRQFTSIMITIQNLAVLSLAMITSLVDPVGILVRSQDLTATMDALRAGANEISIAIKQLVGADVSAQQKELRNLAEALGTIEDHLTNEALEWEYGSNYLTPRLKAANEWFFKAIGLSQWTRLTRVMALAGGKAFIKRHVSNPNKNSKRFLKQLDLTAADVKFDENGDLFILTRLEREDPSLAREELARDDRVRNALNRFVDESILRPNAAQRPIWGSDPNYALIIHLKSFMFSFHDRILRRVAQEASLGNITPLILLAVFIPGMMMADALKDMIRYGLGANPRKAKWDFGDHTWNATQRSGLTGLGQLLMDARNAQQVGELGLFELAGPTAEMLSDMPDLFLGNDEQQWRQFTRNIPFQNVWRHWMENASE